MSGRYFPGKFTDMFKLIVAGPRNFTDYEAVRREVAAILLPLPLLHSDIQIVSGACDRGIITFTREDGTNVCGADGLGERFAQDCGYSVRSFPAEWIKYGKSAGPLRNRQMCNYADACIVFGNGTTRGSKDMADVARAAGKLVRPVRLY